MLLTQTASPPACPTTPSPPPPTAPSATAAGAPALARVAVCVCTCERIALLARTLSALERADLGGLDPDRVVLVVVDNRPDGRVRALCRSLRPRLPMRLVFVEEGRRGISYARNRALEVARAEDADFVAFIDDDDLPRPDWLWRLVQRQRETGADLVFGLWRLPSDVPLPSWLRDSRYFRPPRLDDRNRFGLPAWAGTYNVLLSRRAVELRDGPEGPFRSEFAHCGGEDSDFFIRARRAGLSHACARESVVVRAWEHHRLTLREVLRRGFLRGGSRVHIARAHLPAAEVRGLVWSSGRKLLKALVRLPLRGGGGRDRLVAGLLAVAQSLGEVYAWTGQRYAYYLRRRG